MRNCTNEWAGSMAYSAARADQVAARADEARDRVAGSVHAA